MLLSAGTVVTTLEDDPAAHMLTSLGDPRPAGRFFHYFDLSVNTRLWGQDVIFNPLHLIRLISIGLGSGLAGWGILLMGVHSFLFLVVYHYSRTVLRVTRTAGLTGAAAAFFSLSWAEWIATVYWMPAAILLAVSLGEYWLFLKTARRRHLLVCAVANALQPYLSLSSVLLPTQVYLFGAVLLMALYRKGSWTQTVFPWILFVWPLTALGWVPILASTLFSLGSGWVARYGAKQLTWGLDGSVFTGLLGFLCPSPTVAGDLLSKLGWFERVQSPNNFLFGSFLFLPSVLALWQSKQRAPRILLVGMALYIGSLVVAELIQVPSPLVGGLGFYRVFLFPLLSGFMVAAGIGLPEFDRSDSLSARILHRLYLLLLCGAAVIFLALCALNADQLSLWASRAGMLGSGVMIPQFLRGTRAWAVGITLGLTGYFGYRSLHSAPLRSAALCVAIAAPTLGFGYGQGWYVRQPGLDVALAPPSEFRFLRKRIPNYEYRVGLILASNVHLAQGDWKGFWALVMQRENAVLSYLSADDKSLRQGLAFLLPSLHFYTPTHRQLRADGDPFLNRPESPQGVFLNRRRAEIVEPGAESFEDYGVRYWLSNFNLQSLHPGKFSRVYQGEYAGVFENKNAKPVAFFLEEPRVPLSLEHFPYGIAVRLQRPKGGRLSLHVDLRGMKARAIGPDGRTTPLALQSSGLRWEVEVPPGSSAVLFTAGEAVSLQWLAASSGVAFVLLALAGMRHP